MRAILGAVVFVGLISPALAQNPLPQGSGPNSVWSSNCNCYVTTEVWDPNCNCFVMPSVPSTAATITYDSSSVPDESNIPVAPVALLKWRWWHLAVLTWDVRNSISRNLRDAIVSAKDLADDGKALQKNETELRALEAAINALSPEKK